MSLEAQAITHTHAKMGKFSSVAHKYTSKDEAFVGVLVLSVYARPFTLLSYGVIS